MPKLSTDVYDGQPGHAGIHNFERQAHNENDDRITAAQSRADSAYSLAQSKSTKPASGWAMADLDPAVRTLLENATVATTSTTRPSGAGTALFKGADPGTNALAGVDLWIGEPAP